MKYRTRNYIGFVVMYIILTAVIISGCSTENPLCTDNYCVEGEIFLRSELGNRDFSELNVDDSELLAVLAGAEPIESEPMVPTITVLSDAVSNIVSNVKAGNTNHKGYVVNIDAQVLLHSDIAVGIDEDELVLKTDDDDNVTFWVNSHDKPNLIRNFKSGIWHNFTILIADIYYPDEGGYIIWSHIATTDIHDMTLKKLVNHAKVDNKTYQGTFVSVNVTVIAKNPNDVRFKTNHNKIEFIARDTGGSDFEKYEVGKSYDVLVFIAVIGSNALYNNGEPTILSYFVK